VRARVALVRAQAVGRPELDPVGERDQGRRGVGTCSQNQRSDATLESLGGGNDPGFELRCCPRCPHEVREFHLESLNESLAERRQFLGWRYARILDGGNAPAADRDDQ
jgi:hypothetical protein